MTSTALKLVSLGDETGVVLPAALLARLHVQQDGTVIAKETPGGIVLLSANAADGEQMRAARRIMREREGVLRALARS